MRLLITGLLTSASLVAASAASAATGTLDAQSLSAHVITNRYFVSPSFSKSPVVFSGKEDSRLHLQKELAQLGLANFTGGLEGLGATREASHKKSPQDLLMTRGLGTGSGEGAPSSKTASSSKGDETTHGARAVAFDGSSATVSSSEREFSVASGSARHQGASFTQPIPIQTIVGDAAGQDQSSQSSPHSASRQSLQGNGDVMSPRASYAEGASSRESISGSARKDGLAAQESYGIPDAPPPPSEDELARATFEILARQGQSLPVRVGSAARGSGPAREGNENGLLFQIERALSRLNHVNINPLRPSRTAHGVTREQLIEQRQHLRKTLTKIADSLRNASHNGSTVSESDLTHLHRVLASLSSGTTQVSAADLDQLRNLVDKLSVLPVPVASTHGSGQGSEEPVSDVPPTPPLGSDEPQGPSSAPEAPPPPPDDEPPSASQLGSSGLSSGTRRADGRISLDVSMLINARSRLGGSNTTQVAPQSVDYFAMIPQSFKVRFSPNGLRSFQKNTDLVKKIALLTPQQWETFNNKISGFTSERMFYTEITGEPWLKGVVIEERAATVTVAQTGGGQDPRLGTLVGKERDIVALLPLARQKQFLDGPEKVAALRALPQSEKETLERDLKALKPEDRLRAYSILLSRDSLRTADERDFSARSSATGSVGNGNGNGQPGLPVAPGPRFQKPPAPTPESLQTQITALTAENAASQRRITELESEKARKQTDPSFNAKQTNDEIEGLRRLVLTNQTKITEKTRYRERLLSKARLVQSATQPNGGSVVVAVGSGVQTSTATQEQLQAVELVQLRTALGGAASILGLLRPKDQLWIKGKTILLHSQTGTSRVAVETRTDLVDWLRGLNGYQLRDLHYVLGGAKPGELDERARLNIRMRLIDKNVYDFVEGRRTSAKPYAEEVTEQLKRQQATPGSGSLRRNVNNTVPPLDDSQT